MSEEIEGAAPAAEPKAELTAEELRELFFYRIVQALSADDERRRLMGAKRGKAPRGSPASKAATERNAFLREALYAARKLRDRGEPLR